MADRVHRRPTVFRAVAVSFVIVLIIGFGLLKVHQSALNRHNERLLADFHSIRLNQTTWPEAQSLMQRWGKDGHAHGPCTPIDCSYDITVVGWPSLLPNGSAASWLYRRRYPALLLQLVGLRFSVLDLRFLVEDGAVRRTRLTLTAETQDTGNISPLLVNVISHTSLEEAGAMRTVGVDEELGIHPDYVVGPDSFCTGCETISLDYTPHLAQDELVRLTSFHLACLTRNLPCLHLSGVAPALMREDGGHLRDVPRNSVPCATPVWALARDAKAIWLVDALFTERVLDPDPLYGQKPSLIEQDRIQLVQTLKGPPLVSSRTSLLFYPYSGVEYEARGVPEHLAQGRRYILLPSADDYWQQNRLKKSAQAWYCGVIEDTPENEEAITLGISMNDHLRAPELPGVWPW